MANLTTAGRIVMATFGATGKMSALGYGTAPRTTIS